MDRGHCICVGGRGPVLQTRWHRWTGSQRAVALCRVFVFTFFPCFPFASCLTKATGVWVISFSRRIYGRSSVYCILLSSSAPASCLGSQPDPLPCQISLV